jgi:hypothetical protein
MRSEQTFDSGSLHELCKLLLYRQISERRSGRVYNVPRAASKYLTCYFVVTCSVFGGSATSQQLNKSRSALVSAFVCSTAALWVVSSVTEILSTCSRIASQPIFARFSATRTSR